MSCVSLALRCWLVLILLASVAALQAAEPGKPRPPLREFLGVNGHTVQFKPKLYAEACRLVRDYHSFEWDMGKETDFVPRFPEARNRVNWNDVYGSWKAAGFETDVCVMFNNTPPDSWKDMAKDARAYGQAIAKAFGPSSEKALVTSVEIGNEPGHYSDEQYRQVFRSMTEGVRAGDPKLKVVTCNMIVGKSGKYEKSVDCVAGLESLYDVLSIHTYAMAEQWPTWKRSYPEDPGIEFLKSVEALIAWRNEKTPGKEIWVTEFGWDATTKPNHPSGDFAKWAGNVSDEQQAQYLVRAFLVFASMDVDRAYLYFFNDSDEPSFHASSGITRNFTPKPSFYALGHLLRTLGDYRFHRTLEKQVGEVYAWEFVHATNPKQRAIVTWSPTGSGRSAEVSLPLNGGQVIRAEKMPLKEGPAATVNTTVKDDKVQLKIDESPTYVFLEEGA